MSCLFSNHMELEFERFGLRKQRRLVGMFQLIGSAGLLVGWIMPWIGLCASLGLGLMMVLGTAVRFRVRDTLLQTMPALFFMAINFWIAYGYLAKLNIR
ncbi:MAG: DoxX family protein [Pontiella sp.]|nr:DoxX family protein [Pontiella sp.]MBT8046748.1 DoxX family protein [Pontiella sp.]